MKIDNRFALAVSLAIVASLTSAVAQVQAEGDAVAPVEMKVALTQMKKSVNVNTSLTKTKLRTMSADSVVQLQKEGKINLTTAELGEVKSLVRYAKKVNPKLDPGNVSIVTVMCPW